MNNVAWHPSRWIAALALLGSVGLVPLTSGSAEARLIGSGPDCGSTVRKATGGLWRCTFADEFSGTQLDSTKWTPLTTYNTGVVSRECRVESPRTIALSGGSLALSAIRANDYWCETKTGGYWTDYLGGGVATKGKFNQAFGRFEARIKLPSSTEPGLHSAWWLWPEETIYGASSGEVDIAEWRSGLADRAAPALHYGDVDAVNWHCYITDPTAWHTFAVEWTDTSMRFVYDGRVCWDTTVQSIDGLKSPKPFDEPFFLLLNQAVGTGLNSATDATEGGTMHVDYVHVWR